MVSKPLIWGLGNIHEYCSLMHVFFLQRRCCAWFFCFAFALWLHTCVLFWRLCLHGALEFLVLWLSDMPLVLLVLGLQTLHRLPLYHLFYICCIFLLICFLWVNLLIVISFFLGHCVFRIFAMKYIIGHGRESRFLYVVDQ